jgi:hypothetical protein
MADGGAGSYENRLREYTKEPWDLGYLIEGPYLEQGKQYYMQNEIPPERMGLRNWYYHRGNIPKYYRKGVLTHSVPNPGSEYNFNSSKTLHFRNVGPNPLAGIYTDVRGRPTVVHAFSAKVYNERSNKLKQKEKSHRGNFFTVRGETYTMKLPHKLHNAATKIQRSWRQKTAKRALTNLAHRPPGTLNPENTGGEAYKLGAKRFQSHKLEAASPEYAAKFHEWEGRVGPSPEMAPTLNLATVALGAPEPGGGAGAANPGGVPGRRTPAEVYWQERLWDPASSSAKRKIWQSANPEVANEYAKWERTLGRSTRKQRR